MSNAKEVGLELLPPKFCKYHKRQKKRKSNLRKKVMTCYLIGLTRNSIFMEHRHPSFQEQGSAMDMSPHSQLDCALLSKS